MAKFEFSCAKVEDIDILMKHRLGMFNDMYPELRREIQKSEEQTRKCIRELLSEDRLAGFIVRTDKGQVAGSG
jgi:hypothetical protein